jgi:hypothetical protein
MLVIALAVFVLRKQPFSLTLGAIEAHDAPSYLCAQLLGIYLTLVSTARRAQVLFGSALTPHSSLLWRSHQFGLGRPLSSLRVAFLPAAVSLVSLRYILLASGRLLVHSANGQS